MTHSTAETASHRYYLKHKEEVKRRAKEWAAANPEKRKAQTQERTRRYRERNPQDEQAKKTATERTKQWQKANPEKVNAKNQAWRTANPEKHKASQKKWSANNPAKRLEQAQVRRARKLGAYIEPVNRAIVYKRANGICGICGLSVPYNAFHVDHIVPLSKGGLHCYANTQPAHTHCNLRKSNKLS